MEVEQEKKEEGYQIALDLQVFDGFDIEEDVAMYLCKAEKNAQNLEVTVVLDMFVGHLAASLALFKAVIVVLEVPDYLAEGATFNADVEGLLGARTAYRINRTLTHFILFEITQIQL